MNTFRSRILGSRSRILGSLIVLLVPLWLSGAHAQPTAGGTHPDSGAASASQEQWGGDSGSQERSETSDHSDARDRSEAGDHSDADERSDERDDSDWRDHWGWFEHRDWRDHFFARHRHGNSVVHIGGNSHLAQGDHADAVVSIFGSSSSEGDARDVVSILGNTQVSGPVEHSAVAVLGNTYVDSSVGGDVVAVLGNVELGPHADVEGDVAAVGGTVMRDPAASVHGNVQSVGGIVTGFNWLRPWIDHCLLYGRPLALVSGIEWAWGLAVMFLALYLCLALLFRRGLTQCVHTLETQPGMTLVASLLTMLLTPILLMLLCITVIGIAAVPFVVFALFCAGLFGKAVMLAWLGRRCVGARTTGALGHPAITVLIGGIIVLALYVVPILGFVVYKLLGLFGLGTVVYTLALTARAHRAAPQDSVAAQFGSAPAAAAASAAAAGTAAAAGAAAGGPAAPGAAPSTAAAAALTVTASLPRAGFWIRMAALLLDALLVGFLMGVLHEASDLHLLVLAVYGAVMWKLRGATIGGIVFDLQVVRLDGRALDWETAIVRALGCFLSLAVVGLGFFWIGFDAGKQAWHDKIAGTCVVRVPKGVPLG
jgi:uncharacterized RDD family membrane protein YckC